MSAHDHVRIGSNATTMTGTVVPKPIDEGAIGGLDDLVSRYRPDVPRGDRIAIRDLLDVRSGLESPTSRRDLDEALDADPGRVWHPEEPVRLRIAPPPVAPPRDALHLSNTKAASLGLIAEAASGGSPLAELFGGWILAPLGVGSTSLPAIDPAAIPDPHPRGDMPLSNAQTMAGGALPPDLRAQVRDGTLRLGGQTDGNPSWAWAAGGAISTLGDLVTHVEALVGGGPISPELQAERLASLRPVSPAAADPRYGIGLATFGPYVGHDGTLPGFRAFMGHDPEADSTVVVATDLTHAPDGRETPDAIVMATLSAPNG